MIAYFEQGCLVVSHVLVRIVCDFVSSKERIWKPYCGRNLVSISGALDQQWMVDSLPSTGFLNRDLLLPLLPLH